MNKTVKRLVMCLVLLISVIAAGTMAGAAKKKSNEWFKTKYSHIYYYNKNGERVTGKKVIGKHTYYFGKDARQRVGWQKIGKEYYFFRIAEGKKGYMVTNKTVNGIKINAKGVANRSSGYNRRKLALMVAANQTLESLTHNSFRYSKREKLRKCFNYTERKYYCCNLGSFRNTSTWDMDYAERVIIPKDRQYRADCYTYGCGMAYLANACGAKAAAVSSGGHGWCEVDGYVCDSNWSRVDRAHNYFMRSYNTYEPGTPPYKSSRLYVKRI